MPESTAPHRTRHRRVKGILLMTMIALPVSLSAAPLADTLNARGDLAPIEIVTHAGDAFANRAAIDQTGVHHDATITQRGENNDALIRQRGIGHEAEILQLGAGNRARIDQFGWHPQRAAIEQRGDENDTLIRQGPGTRTGVDVLQHGDGLQLKVEVGR